MKATKLISICIPTYNRARLLEETLTSILSQLSDDMEIVISDNGSTDGTEEMVNRYRQKCPCIRYSRNENNLGFDRNVLACLARAEGEYVWFFSSDDLMKPGAVQALREALKDKPSLVVFNHDVFGIREGAPVIYDRSGVGWGKTIRFSSPNACVAVVGLTLGFISALVLKREMCHRTPDIQEIIGSGWIHLHIALWLLKQGSFCLYIGTPFVSCRAGPSVDYDLVTEYFHEVNRVIWNSRKYGYPWWLLYFFINRVIVQYVLRAVVVLRSQDKLDRRVLLPLVLKEYWAFPLFWLIVFPWIFVPQSMARGVRFVYREVRLKAFGLGSGNAGF